ncbi:hypothetical protein M127_0791 [Bacteroides fragilis str. S6L5]|nr:hypothetical protein M127_0791 [Bacteroides fragilis str. S6L5]
MLLFSETPAYSHQIPAFGALDLGFPEQKVLLSGFSSPRRT